MPHNATHAPTHAVVWLDFHQAKIFLIKAEDVEARRIGADTPHRQIHHKAQVRGSGHVRDDRTYFEAILAAIEEADSWLIAGPGGTKKDLEKYLEGHGEELKKKLVGVEPMDHPTDGELIRQARKLFEPMTA
jgi:stalled ribosome rescue protein Dom34